MKVPVNVTVLVPEPVATIPTGKLPTTNSWSPEKGLVNTIDALSILASLLSNIELSVSAIETDGPFSVNVAAQL